MFCAAGCSGGVQQGGALVAAMKDHWTRFGLQGGKRSRNGWVLVEVGGLYYMYMTLLTIFCTNAINIYAGACQQGGPGMRAVADVIPVEGKGAAA